MNVNENSWKAPPNHVPSRPNKNFDSAADFLFLKVASFLATTVCVFQDENRDPQPLSPFPVEIDQSDTSSKIHSLLLAESPTHNRAVISSQFSLGGVERPGKGCYCFYRFSRVTLHDGSTEKEREDQTDRDQFVSHVSSVQGLPHRRHDHFWVLTFL